MFKVKAPAPVSVPASKPSLGSSRAPLETSPGRRAIAAGDGFEGAARRAVNTGLQAGCTGPAVRDVQRKLVAAGFMRPAEMMTGPGVFGPRTVRAVQQFQLSRGLSPSGVVGEATRAALESADKFQTRRAEEDDDVTQPMTPLELLEGRAIY